MTEKSFPTTPMDRAESPWQVGEPVTVRAEDVGDFATAIGEPGSLHPEGSPVLPTFPVTLTWAAQGAALRDQVLQESLTLHGEQAFAYHRPILVGDTLIPRARVEAVRVRGGNTAVTSRTELHDDTGLVCSQHFTVMQIGVQRAESGEQSLLATDPGPVGDTEEIGRLSEIISQNQAQLYSDASGDHYPIHTDEEFARSQGLAGVILHGMCTMAFAARAVVRLADDGDQRKLGFIAVRFSAPAGLGATLTTQVQADLGTSSGTFQTHTEDGTAVLTRGRYALTGG